MKLSLIRSLILAAVLAVVACSGTTDGGNVAAGVSDPSTNGGATGGGTTGGGTTGGGTTGGGTTGGGTTGGGTTGGGTTGGGTTGGGAAGSGTIFTIVMENHDYAEIVGSANAPYFNSLIAQYGLATNYMDSGTHPSLPNYLTMISGATQYAGGVDLLPTASPFPVTTDNLGTQMQTAGIKWRSYQESASAACNLGTNSLYAPKHDPFLYFTDMQAASICDATSVDYSNFEADLTAGTYRYMWITPNLTDDGHNPSTTAADIITGLKDSDTWASTEIPKIIASDAFKNGGVIFLTWDEAEGHNGDSKDQIPMIVISPNIASAGFKSTTAHSHKSYLATVEDMMGLPRLATVASEPAMSEFFK